MARIIFYSYSIYSTPVKKMSFWHRKQNMCKNEDSSNLLAAAAAQILSRSLSEALVDLEELVFSSNH
jgi:Fe-S cluster biosynthesis and repair protein YggX